MARRQRRRWRLSAARPDALVAVLVHEGIVVRLAAPRLTVGKFVWPKGRDTQALIRAQLNARVPGLPWQRSGQAGVITML